MHYEIVDGYINPCVRPFDLVAGIFVRKHSCLKLCTVYDFDTFKKVFSNESILNTVSSALIVVLSL